MGEIIPFDLALEPFVRIEPSGDAFAVTFENLPKLRGLNKTFADRWEAFRYGFGFALGEDIALLWRPGRLDLSQQAYRR